MALRDWKDIYTDSEYEHFTQEDWKKARQNYYLKRFPKALSTEKQEQLRMKKFDAYADKVEGEVRAIKTAKLPTYDVDIYAREKEARKRGVGKAIAYGITRGIAPKLARGAVGKDLYDPAYEPKTLGETVGYNIGKITADLPFYAIGGAAKPFGFPLTFALPASLDVATDPLVTDKEYASKDFVKELGKEASLGLATGKLMQGVPYFERGLKASLAKGGLAKLPASALSKAGALAWEFGALEIPHLAASVVSSGQFPDEKQFKKNLLESAVTLGVLKAGGVLRKETPKGVDIFKKKVLKTKDLENISKKFSNSDLDTPEGKLVFIEEIENFLDSDIKGLKHGVSKRELPKDPDPVGYSENVSSNFRKLTERLNDERIEPQKYLDYVQKKVDISNQFLQSINKESLKDLNYQERDYLRNLAVDNVRLKDPNQKMILQPNGTLLNNSEIQVMKNLKKPKMPLLFYGFRNQARFIKDLGGEDAVNTFVEPLRVAETLRVVNQSKEFKDVLKMQGKKNLNSKSKLSENLLGSLRVALNARQKGEPISHLLPKEVARHEAFLLEQLKGWHSRINTARAINGEKPIGFIKDYFTLEKILGEVELRGEDITQMPVEQIKRIHSEAGKWEPFKKRKGVGEVSYNPYRTLEKYMIKANKHTYLSPILLKLDKMIENAVDETGESFSLKKENPRAYESIKGVIDLYKGRRKPTFSSDFVSSKIDPIFNKFNKDYSVFTLAGNLRSIGVQPFAIKNALAEFGQKSFGVGVAGLFDPKSRAFAEKYSKNLKSRIPEALSAAGDESGFTIVSGKLREKSETLDKVYEKLGRYKERAAETGITPLKLFDYETATASFLAGFDYAKKRGMNFREAIDFADKKMIDINASAQPVDLAPIQTTPLGKTLTLFQTYGINHLNYLFDKTLGTEGKEMSKKEKSKWISRYLIATGFSNSVASMFWDDPPDPAPLSVAFESEEQGMAAFYEALKEVATATPVVGGAVRYGETNIFGALGKFAAETAEFLNNANKMEFGKMSKTAAKLAAKWKGVPGGNQMFKLLSSDEYKRKD